MVDIKSGKPDAAIDGVGVDAEISQDGNVVTSTGRMIAPWGWKSLYPKALYPGTLEDAERQFIAAMTQAPSPSGILSGFRPGTIYADDVAAKDTYRTQPRSYRMTRIFRDRDARLSPDERRDYLMRDIESHILSNVHSRGRYKEKQDHKQGGITATMDVSLSDFVSGMGETPLIDDEKITREVKEAVWSGLQHVLADEIRTLEARDGYQDDVRADALRNLQDKLEKTL